MGDLEELLVALGFDYDPEQLEDFRSDIAKTAGMVKVLVQAGAAATAAMVGLAVATTRASDRQGQFAEDIDTSVEQVDALEFALRSVGGSAEGATNSLVRLSSIASQAARGVGPGVEVFGMLGLSVRDANGELKDTPDLMREISARFQGLSRGRQQDFAEQLGLSDSLRILRQGPEALDELIERAERFGVTTEEDARISRELQTSLTDLWQVIKDGSRMITRIIAPAVQETIDLFTEWYAQTRDLIEQNLPDWVDSLTQAFKLLSVAVGFYLAHRLIWHFVTLVGLLRGASVAAVLFNGAMMLLPILVTALAVAFAALIEDAVVFFQGGDSFINDMIEKYPEWEDQIYAVAAALATVWDTTSMIWEGWKGIFGLFRDLSNLSAPEFLEKMSDFFDNLPGFILDATGIRTTDDVAQEQMGRTQSEIDRIQARGDANRIMTQTLGSTLTVENFIQQITGAGNPSLVGQESRNQFIQAHQDLSDSLDM